MSRMCFECDESGHWYCIPVELKDRFNEMLYADEFDDVVFNDEFAIFTLGMHIANYSFTDLKEIDHE